MSRAVARSALSPEVSLPEQGAQILMAGGVLGERIVRRALEGCGWEVRAVGEGSAALDAYRLGGYDVVLLECELPDGDSLTLLQHLRALDPDAAVILLAERSDVPTVVRAMQIGAEHVLARPFGEAELREVVTRALDRLQLGRIAHAHLARTPEPHRLAALGSARAMRGVVDQVDRLASTPATLLIQGETGSGKGWTARLIHSLSARARGPFVEVNCAALSPEDFDAEFFGVEAPAGRRAVRRGLLEAADGGTLFLDDIGDLAPALQPKLISVLQHGRFRRVGGEREVEVDVRILSAARGSLSALRSEGRFRADLYYRVAVHPITLPPLRERGPEAIAELASGILSELRREFRHGPARIAATALDRLVHHAWPGNVRELRNVLERALLFAADAVEILPRHLPPELNAARPAPRAPAQARELASVLAEAERRHIEAVLRELNGNRSATARALGISRAALYLKLDRHGLGS